jgi:Domain of unknown function (DUF5655)
LSCIDTIANHERDLVFQGEMLCFMQPMEKVRKRTRRLWACPRCRQTFVTKNMWHSCSSLTVQEFLRKKPPGHKKLYHSFLKLVRKCGPVKVNVNKSRISFQARVRFAGIPRVTKDGLIGGFWLKHRIESARFTHVEYLPPNNYLYQFRITSEKDLDTQVLAWLREAYKVGQQQE